MPTDSPGLVQSNKSIIDRGSYFLTDNRLKYILVLPALLTIFTITIFPLIFSLYASFHRIVGGDFIFVGFMNFKNFFTDPLVHNSFKVTILFTIFSVLFQFILGFGLALLVHKAIRIGNIVATFFLLPMMVSPVVVGFLWKILYRPGGEVNVFLSYFGIEEQTWLGNINTALPAVIFVDIWQWTPFVFLIMLAGLSSLPKSPFEAAQVDGASSWQAFRMITLPLLKPIILFVLIFRAMEAFRVFDPIWAMTMGGPGEVTSVVSLLIFRNAFRFGQLGYATAISWMVAIFIIIVVTIFLKRFYQTVEA